jgi:hypothetical protein
MLRSARIALVLVAAAAVGGCIMSRSYDQSYDREYTVAKNNFMVYGVENAVEFEIDVTKDSFPIAQAHDTYAVRYMGIDGNGDPILRVLSPDLSRTDITVEQAETDRTHLGGFGIHDVTIIVVDATDAQLTYRMLRVNPWNEKPHGI